MFLLSNQKINDIVIEKTSYFKHTINLYVNKQKDRAIKLQEEIEIQSQFISLQTQLIKDKYCLYVKQLLNDLKSHLSSAEYYSSNFCRLLEINNKYQELLFNYINSKNVEIMAIINQTLNTRDTKNAKIIERLNQRNEFNIDTNIIHLIINKNQHRLSQKIKTFFDRARLDLAEITIAKRRTNYSLTQVKIESQKTTSYPDGECIIDEWELVRIERKQFIEIIDDIGECIVHVFKYLIRSLIEIPIVKTKAK